MDNPDPRVELLNYLKRNKAASEYQIGRSIGYPQYFPDRRIASGIAELLAKLEQEGLIERVLMADGVRWRLKELI